MAAEHHIEAMRDTRRDGRSMGDDFASGDARRSRERRARRRRRRVFALLVFIVLLVVAGLLFGKVFGGEDGGSGGDFVGTWQKGNGQTLEIGQAKSGGYQIVVGGGHTVTKATLSDGVLSAPNMLGVQGLTVTFTLKEGGSVLVETFSNGSSDDLERAE
jgi:hypothetical protein